jgi:hypothetical protein
LKSKPGSPVSVLFNTLPGALIISHFHYEFAVFNGRQRFKAGKKRAEI